MKLVCQFCKQEILTEEFGMDVCTSGHCLMEVTSCLICHYDDNRICGYCQGQFLHAMK